MTMNQNKDANPFKQRDEYYFQQRFEDYSVSSTYVTMRDGVKIAMTICLPKGLSPEEKIPALLYQTRYHRAHHLRLPYRWIWNEIVDYYPKTELFTAGGYAVLFVDVRGCGASYGYRLGPFSEEEVKDGVDIVDWITSQPWSDGNVVSNGISYTGFTAEWLATNNHPKVKSIMTGHSGWDPFVDMILPGGCYNTAFIQLWSFYGKQLDQNVMKQMKMLAAHRWILMKGVKHIHSDKDYSQLKEAIEEHKQNEAVYDNISEVTYRDEDIRIEIAESSFDERSIFKYQEDLQKLNIPIYSWASWLDANFADVVIERFLNLSNPQVAIIGDWNHGAHLPANPYDPSRPEVIPSPRERIKTEISFFNRCLKGGGLKSKTLYYYTMGEERWKKTDIWPPLGQSLQRWYFQENNRLAKEEPEANEGSDDYKVNFRAGTGFLNRWMGPAGTPIRYTDRKKDDEKLYLYTSLHLENDLEITGNPIVTLYLSSTHEDGAIFVYLEDVDEEGNVIYITDGNLRLIHRKVSSEKPPYKTIIPYHSFLKKDALPLVPNEVAEIKFGLHATSVLIKKGHRIRVAIAGADRDMFKRYPAKGKPIITIERNKKYPSFIEIPIISRE
ncbi:MAG: CocE/NonD family hydrolase [Promethearchaeota archaeon]|nr:MAG: CocE/NonD family hydrolase [Candidatus Lokiarchaeota archaeon]